MAEASTRSERPLRPASATFAPDFAAQCHDRPLPGKLHRGGDACSTGGKGPGASIRRRGPQERLAATPHGRFEPFVPALRGSAMLQPTRVV